MLFLVLFLIILSSTPCFSQRPNESADQVWEVGDRLWTVEEEHRFGKWVDETMTEDFFIRYKMPTDCAVPSMRSDGFMPGSTIFPPPF